ncbi:MAG: hypothetical protein ACI8PB_000848 [Desulforhopalus sp.]|jgi:hypothetical protein
MSTSGNRIHDIRFLDTNLLGYKLQIIITFNVYNGFNTSIKLRRYHGGY